MWYLEGESGGWAIDAVIQLLPVHTFLKGLIEWKKLDFNSRKFSVSWHLEKCAEYSWVTLAQQTSFIQTKLIYFFMLRQMNTNENTFDFTAATSNYWEWWIMKFMTMCVGCFQRWRVFTLNLHISKPFWIIYSTSVSPIFYWVQFSI